MTTPEEGRQAVHHNWSARIEVPADSQLAAEVAYSGMVPPDTEVPVTAVYCRECLTDYSDEAAETGCSGEPLRSP